MARRFWTPEEFALLDELYATTPTTEIAARLGRPLQSVYTQARERGLSKAPEYYEQHGGGRRKKGDPPNAASFKPGSTAWNKGLSYRPGGRCAETQFKPGQWPYTWVPVGTEVTDIYGYRKRKVRDDAPPGMSRRNWQFVHILLWEEANGPVPRGHSVVFRDGNRTNLDISNLECITRQALIQRNTVHNLPPELAQVVQLKGQIVRQINKREGKHEKRNRRSAQSPVRDA